MIKDKGISNWDKSLATFVRTMLAQGTISKECFEASLSIKDGEYRYSGSIIEVSSLYGYDLENKNTYFQDKYLEVDSRGNLIYSKTELLLVHKCAMEIHCNKRFKEIFNSIIDNFKQYDEISEEQILGVKDVILAAVLIKGKEDAILSGFHYFDLPHDGAFPYNRNQMDTLLTECKRTLVSPATDILKRFNKETNKPMYSSKTMKSIGALDWYGYDIKRLTDYYGLTSSELVNLDMLMFLHQKPLKDMMGFLDYLKDDRTNPPVNEDLFFKYFGRILSFTGQ